ncbi:hypothetical protein BDR26DRAFT_873717 [Obelidium mucronatum]|nr:hypothetical protein BDR26DRAFT_873717 [Obelidium mucronatum]
MIHILNPYESDICEIARQRQIYERRQRLLHEQRQQEQARLQLLRLMKLKQQAQNHNQRKKAAFVSSPWHSFPLKQAPNAMDTILYRGPSATRTIPIRYADEVMAKDESSETLMNNDAESPCGDAGLESVAPLFASNESNNCDDLMMETCEQPLQPESIESESETQSHLKQIQDLVRDFRAEMVSWRSRLDDLRKTLQLVVGAKGNRPLLEVEEKLTKTLLRADSVESNGVAAVREARKQLIKDVQRLLEDIEQVKQQAVIE